MKIVLVHGFNVRDKGEHTVDKLEPYFPKDWEIEKDAADYGFFNLWAVRFRKRPAIRRIAIALEDADAVIAHSNGANYVLKALKLIQRPNAVSVFFLSPAASRKAKFAESVKKAVVYFTKVDIPVFFAGFLPFHSWGWMGFRGAKTDDPRITNRDCTDIVGSHSDYFSRGNAPFVAGNIEKELKK